MIPRAGHKGSGLLAIQAMEEIVLTDLQRSHQHGSLGLNIANDVMSWSKWRRCDRMHVDTLSCTSECYHWPPVAKLLFRGFLLGPLLDGNLLLHSNMCVFETHSIRIRMRPRKDSETHSAQRHSNAEKKNTSLFTYSDTLSYDGETFD